jgi:hypothetical protein
LAVGRLLNPRGSELPFNPVTGEENQLPPTHSLYWIPVEVRGAILPIAGVFVWQRW